MVEKVIVESYEDYSARKFLKFLWGVPIAIILLSIIFFFIPNNNCSCFISLTNPTIKDCGLISNIFIGKFDYCPTIGAFWGALIGVIWIILLIIFEKRR
jgi:hypothetical protein